jgi:predicted MFS family arabinose efflux permease
VLFEVAHSSLFADLVRRPDYLRANSLVNGSRAMSFVAGPSLGGVLVQVLTAPFALVADVVTFVASAGFLSRMAVGERPVRPEESGGGMAAGMRFVLGSPILRPILLGTSTLNLFNYIFAALFVLYATKQLHIAPGALGLILGSGAVGGLVGAVVAGRITRWAGIGPALILGMVVFPAPLILVPLAHGPVPLFAAEVVSALGVMLLDIAAGSVQTAATPHGRLSVVSGFQRTVNYGIRPVGAVLGGALGTYIGVRPALWVATIGGLIGVLWIVFSPLRTMRELPEAA